MHGRYYLMQSYKYNCQFSMRWMLFLICLMHAFTSSAQEQVYVQFKQDSSSRFRDGFVLVFQHQQWLKYNLTDSVVVTKGDLFDVEFSINNIQYKGIKGLKVFRDTAIWINEISMENVVVESKRQLIKQTLRGFEYFPQSDSVFMNQPLLYALQRLPFVSIMDDQIRYKNESRIWYRINGRDRRVLENSWSYILMAMKTSSIIKVELITDLPLYVKNKNYDLIMNIITEESNFRGVVLNAAVIADSRENLNKNFGFTYVRKKNDYSVTYTNNEDNYTNQKISKTTEGGVLLAQNRLDNTYETNNHVVNVKLGRRIDSLKDIAFSIQYRDFQNSNFWKNTYNNPVPLNDYRNSNHRKEVNAHLSYVFAKSKNIENSISFAFRTGKEEFRNDLIHLISRVDSISRNAQTLDKNVILEFNHRNVAKRKFRYEYGFQIYNKQLAQDFFLYATDSGSNKVLILQKADTMSIGQVVARPYLRLNTMGRKKSMFVCELDVEYFVVTGEGLRTQKLILPSLLTQRKVLLNQSNSISITGEFMYLKPSDNFYKLIQANVNPVEDRTGSLEVTPSKNLELKVEWIKTGKQTFSNELGIQYGFDILNFYTQFDVVSNRLQSYSNNDANMLAVYWKHVFDYSKKRLSFTVGPEIKWMRYSNQIMHQSFYGVVASGYVNGNFVISKNLGSIGLAGTFSSKPVTNQGNATGLSRYVVYYSKRFFKNKLVTTFSAENFMLKERKWDYQMNDGEFINTTQIHRPFRLLNVRIAYRFSTLKNIKPARLKSTQILNEFSEQQ